MTGKDRVMCLALEEQVRSISDDNDQIIFFQFFIRSYVVGAH